MRIILTGGGTCGHIMPNIALLPELKRHFEVFYVGSTKGMEKDIVPKYDIPFYGILCTKLERKLTVNNLFIPAVLAFSIRSARKILKNIKPDIVFSKGGFVSLPVVIAARQLNIPYVIHESDLSLGLANKLVHKKAKYICTTYIETSKQYKNAVYSGLPLKDSLLSASKTDGINFANLDGKKPILLALGGSLGATSLNKLIFDNLKLLTEKYDIIHLVGKNNLNPALVRKGYCQIEFTDKIENLYAASDIVFSRAGSTVINELLLLKKPMLLYPLSKKNSRGDQIENARYYGNLGCCEVLHSPENFLDKLQLVDSQKNYLKTNISKLNIPNATSIICSLLKNSAKSSK